MISGIHDFCKVKRAWENACDRLLKALLRIVEFPKDRLLTGEIKRPSADLFGLMIFIVHYILLIFPALRFSWKDSQPGKYHMGSFGTMFIIFDVSASQTLLLRLSPERVVRSFAFETSSTGICSGIRNHRQHGFKKKEDTLRPDLRPRL